jgi:CDP-diacylglycerol--serine O-phosphatidyltransferase
MTTSGKPKPFSMIREFHLADWFTLGNAICGIGALFSIMTYLQLADIRHIYFACGLLLAALVFDVLDGRIARWRQKTSAMGRELDSLADVISFGVAPATIAYGAGMKGGWDVLILVYFVACGVSRLARFNVTAEQLAASTGKVKYFEGTPIPSSLILIGVVAVMAWRGYIGDALPGGVLRLGPGTLHPLTLLWALSGSLMISKTLRIPKV